MSTQTLTGVMTEWLAYILTTTNYVVIGNNLFFTLNHRLQPYRRDKRLQWGDVNGYLSNIGRQVSSLFVCGGFELATCQILEFIS